MTILNPSFGKAMLLSFYPAGYIEKPTIKVSLCLNTNFSIIAQYKAKKCKKGLFALESH